MFSHNLMMYCIERCFQVDGDTDRIRFEESSSTIPCLLLSIIHVYIQLVISYIMQCAFNLNSYLRCGTLSKAF